MNTYKRWPDSLNSEPQIHTPLAELLMYRKKESKQRLNANVELLANEVSAWLKEKMYKVKHWCLISSYNFTESCRTVASD